MLSFVIFVIDGLIGDALLLTALLAIPPLLAALATNRVETGIVGATCVLLAILSGALHGTFGSPDHFGLLLAVAAGGAIGLAIAELRERLELANRSAELLSAAGEQLIDHALDAERAPRDIAELAVPALADVATVELLTPEGGVRRGAVVAATQGLTDRVGALLERIEVRPDGGRLAARALKHGSTEVLPSVPDQLVDEVAGQIGVPREELAMVAPRSALVVPLRSGDRVLGVLALGIYGHRRRYREGGALATAAESLASRAALALDGAQLHAHQTRIADVLQRNLMPAELPPIPGLSVTTGFEPAGDVTMVGGDFYDLFPVNENSWVLVVGDVCGKGPEAAALTGMVRQTLRVLAPFEVMPSAMLSRLSEHIRTERGDFRFCTAAIVRIARNRSGFRLLASSAGHPSPLIATEEGEVREVTTPGALLGVFPERGERHDESAVLNPGETLFLYTDGLIDDRGNGTTDPQWVGRELGKLDGADPGTFTSELVNAAQRRQHPTRPDDIAVVALSAERTG